MDRYNDNSDVVKKVAEKRADILRERSQRNFRHQLTSTGNAGETAENPQSYLEMLEEGFKKFLRTTLQEQEWHERPKEKQGATEQFVADYQPVKKIYDGLYHALLNYRGYQEAIKKDDVSVETLQHIHMDMRTLRKEVGVLASNTQFPLDAQGDIKAFLDEKIARMEKARKDMGGLNQNDDHSREFDSQATLEYMDRLHKSTTAFAETLQKSGITSLQTMEQNIKDLQAEIEEKVKAKLTDAEKQFDRHYRSLQFIHEYLQPVYGPLEKPLQSYYRYNKELSQSGNISLESLQKMHQHTCELLEQVKGVPSNKQLSKVFFTNLAELTQGHESKMVRARDEITKAGSWLKLDNLNSDFQRIRADMDPHYGKIENWLSVIKACANGKDIESNLKDLSKDIDKSIEKAIFDKTTKETLSQIKAIEIDLEQDDHTSWWRPEVVSSWWHNLWGWQPHDETLAPELDKEKMKEMILFEKKYGIEMKEKTTRWLYKNSEKRLASLEEKVGNKYLTQEQKEELQNEIKENINHQWNLYSLYKEKYQQYKELEDKVMEHRNKRKNIRKSKGILEAKQRELKNRTHSDNQHDTYSPSVLDILVERIDEIESPFNLKIAKMQEHLKNIFEDIDKLYDGFFLDLQKGETDYYKSHPNLEHMQQGAGDCGIVCTWMVLADRNKEFIEEGKAWNKLEELLATFEKKMWLDNPEEGTPLVTYPSVLKEMGHSIEYEVCQYMTPDQLKNAIGQKDSEGEPIPIFAIFHRAPEGRKPYNHAIIVDNLVEIEGEEWVIYRDPNFVEGERRRLDDFLEVWNGQAVIPTKDPEMKHSWPNWFADKT